MYSQIASLGVSEVRNNVIGQDEAMKKLTAVMIKHKIVSDNPSANLPQTNIFLCGNSGCGKTYMATKIAEAAGLNVIFINCSMLSQEGYKGLNLNQAIYNNYKCCLGLEKHYFSRSVIILDEFDKTVDNFNKDSRSAAIFDLLPLLDGKYKLDLSEFKREGYIDLSRCLIILAGACYSVKQQKARKTNAIGFSEQEKIDNESNPEFITENDLINCGYPTEIMGRISQIINVNSLSKSDLEKIITNSDDSAFNQYKRFYKLLDVNLKITNAAKSNIAELASRKKTGARALKTIFDDLLLDEIENASNKNNLSELIISWNKNQGLYVKQKYDKKIKHLVQENENIDIEYISA